QYGVDAEDCIVSGNTTTLDFHRSFENLTLLGNGYGAQSHGIYGAGNHLVMRNIRIYNCYHGIAIHGSYVNISDIYLFQCSGSAIIPSAKAAGQDVWHVNINNVVIEGTAGSNFRVMAGAIQVGTSDAARSAKYINISNVTARNCVNGALSIDRGGSGTLSNINVTNMVSTGNVDLAVVGDFRFNSGDMITLTNCQSIGRVNGYGFRHNTDCTLGAIYLDDCLADASGSGASAGTFVTARINGTGALAATDVTASGNMTATGTVTATGR